MMFEGEHAQDVGLNGFLRGADLTLGRVGLEPWIDCLSTAERLLLERLHLGRTIYVAAAEAYLSLRTANRRLAELRRRAGVASTRELVHEYETLLASPDGPGAATV